MENNQMTPLNENGVFNKIKQFFRKLFGKKEDFVSTTEEFRQEEIKEEKASDIKSGFFEDIKVDSSGIDKLVNTKNLISQIDENVEILKELSMEQLVDIRDYYKNIIEQNEMTIKKLQEG